MEALFAELQKANQEQEGTLKDQEEHIKALEEENILLKAAIAKAEATGTKAEAPKSTNTVVKVDGKKYSILRKTVHIPGIGTRSAEELAQDAEALKKILSMEGQNILKEIK